MAAGAVTWGYNTVEKLKEMYPDELFRDMNELLAKIGYQDSPLLFEG